MNDPIQSAQHPDADALSAFAENALSAHQRETVLSHLAECADCRSIVYLAQETAADDAALEDPVIAVTPARKPWFAGWRVLWPATALACAILITVVSRQSAHRGKESVAGNSASIAQVEPKRATDEVGAAHSDDQVPGKTESAQESRLAVHRPAASPMGSLDEKSGKNVPVNGRQVSATGAQESAGSAVAGGALQAEPDAATVDAKKSAQIAGGVALGKASGASVVAAPLGNHVAGSLFSAPAAPAANSANHPAEPPAPASPALRVQAIGPPSEPRAIEAAHGNLEVSAASVVLTDSSAAQPQFHLPSHLQAASAITSGSMVLAVDTAGTLFASRDAGGHWKRIAPRWTGHAVRVNFAPGSVTAPMPATAQPQAKAAAVPALSSNSMQNAPSSAATAGHGVLTGVVTDRTGAVVPHATITATSEATAQSISVKTDMAGKFSLSGLEPGVYTVQAQMPGFQLQRISGIRLGASAGVVQNFSLEVGAAAETVTVEASNSTLQTESANLVPPSIP